MSLHLTHRYTEALSWAIQLHADQTRKGTAVPYIGHLLSVSAIVIEHDGSEDEAIAGLLHDAVEDQGGAETRAEIARRFGEPVAEIVDGCTDDSPAAGQPKRPWRARKEAYIAHVRAETSASILLVSASDKLHNSRAILDDYNELGEAVWDRFNASREEILWYYASLVEAFGQAEERLNASGFNTAPLTSLLNKLEATVEELHLMAEVGDFSDTMDELGDDL